MGLTPLEVYTSSLPVVCTHNFGAGTRYWLCVSCIPGIAPAFFKFYEITAVTEGILDLMADPAAFRHCDKCHAPLFHNFSTTE